MFNFGMGKSGFDSRFGNALGKACANNSFQGQNPFKIDCNNGFGHTTPTSLFGKPCAPFNFGGGVGNHGNGAHHGDMGHVGGSHPFPWLGGHDGHGFPGPACDPVHDQPHDGHHGSDGHGHDGHGHDGHGDQCDDDHGGSAGTGFPAIPADTTGITFHVDFDGDGLMDQYIYIQLEEGVDPASMKMEDYYKSAVDELKDINPDANPSDVIVKATVYSPSEYETHFYLTGDELGTDDDTDDANCDDKDHDHAHGDHHGHGLHSSHGHDEHAHHGEHAACDDVGDAHHDSGDHAAQDGADCDDKDTTPVDDSADCASGKDDHKGDDTADCDPKDGGDKGDASAECDGTKFYKMFVGMFGDVAHCDPAPEEDDAQEEDEGHHKVLENCL
jgi:hypothetical protein